MSNVSQWETSAPNNDAAPPDGAPEGMAANTVNDTMREMMAATARWYQDINGSLVTGGAGNAYTLTTNNNNSSLTDLPLVVFVANRANSGAATLNVDGLGAKSLRFGGVALAAGVIQEDVAYIAIYNAEDDAFDIVGYPTKDASEITTGELDDARLSSNVMLTGAYGLGSQNLPSSVDMDFVNTTQFNAQFTSPSGPGGQGWAYLTLARSQERVAQIAVRADIADRTNGNLIAVRHSEDASNGLWYPWRFLWHTGNFDPSTKANASHTHSAEDITSGTLSDARLPATIGGDKTFSDNVTVGGTISGNGSGLTNLNASNLSSGTVPDARLSSNVMLTGAYGLGSQNLGNLSVPGGIDFLNTTQFYSSFSSATGPGGQGWAYLTLARNPTR